MPMAPFPPQQQLAPVGVFVYPTTQLMPGSAPSTEYFFDVLVQCPLVDSISVTIGPVSAVDPLRGSAQVKILTFGGVPFQIASPQLDSMPLPFAVAQNSLSADSRTATLVLRGAQPPPHPLANQPPPPPPPLLPLPNTPFAPPGYVPAYGTGQPDTPIPYTVDPAAPTVFSAGTSQIVAVFGMQLGISSRSGQYIADFAGIVKAVLTYAGSNLAVTVP